MGQGDLTNDLKLKIYPAIIVVLGLSLVALLLSRIQIQIASSDSTPVMPLPTEPEVPPAPEIPAPSSPSSIAESPATPTPQAPVAPSPTTAASAKLQGGLRVRNQTPFPIRLALLPQQSSESAITYNQPVHWDFAPEEGKAKGLILSLPDRTLSLQAGDVLVAFAQDGSRRYWGPYVVGKTTIPNWSDEQREWSLILQP